MLTMEPILAFLCLFSERKCLYLQKTEAETMLDLSVPIMAPSLADTVTWTSLLPS